MKHICPYCSLAISKEDYNQHLSWCFEEYKNKQNTKEPAGPKEESKQLTIGGPE